MNWQNTLQVARWEFVEKARTKAFILSLFLTPIITVGFYAVMILLSKMDNVETKNFGIIDATSQYAEPLSSALDTITLNNEGKKAFVVEKIPYSSTSSLEQQMLEADKLVFEGKLNGIFIIPPTINNDRRVEYRSENVGNIKDLNQVVDILENLVNKNVANEKGVDLALYEEVVRSIDPKTVKITATGEAKESGFGESFGMAYGSGLLMFMLIVLSGQLLVRSLVEEKSNRIIEILVSSCSSFELMMGKLIGISGLGILQVSTWVGLAIVGLMYFGMSVDIIATLPLQLLFMILGYVLYASVLLGAGSLTNNEQEAQQVTGYITMAAILPIALIVPVLQDPNASYVKILSFIPFISQTIMSMRIALLMPAWWEILLSSGIIIATTVVVLWLAAKIFRVAILSYGKRATLPEIIEYLREK